MLYCNCSKLWTHRKEASFLFYMGKIIGAKELLHAKEQFGVVDDEKLRMSIVALSNKYSEDIREMIHRAYNDPELASIYRGWRRIYQFDNKGKHSMEWVRFPNGYIFDFVNTVLTTIYGVDWMQNKKAMKHELVRPWWIREKI